MLFCRTKLTGLQRRSMQRVGAVLMLTVVTNLANPRMPNPLLDMMPGAAEFLERQHASAGLAAALSALSLLPILLAVWIAASYLKQETDEFVRALVTRALLWGFAVTMAGDSVLGVLTMMYGRPFPISLLNADVFLVSTGVAFRLLRRGYR